MFTCLRQFKRLRTCLHDSNTKNTIKNLSDYLLTWYSRTCLHAHISMFLHGAFFHAYVSSCLHANMFTSEPQSVRLAALLRCCGCIVSSGDDDFRTSIMPLAKGIPVLWYSLYCSYVASIPLFSLQPLLK